MELDKTTHIDTPEGVAIELTLAGIGSRFVAQFVDSLIKLAGALALIFMAGLMGADGAIAQALLALAAFVSIFVYDVAFEAAWSGRTPGKRSAGIRVVGLDGSPVGFFRSAVRNLLRIIDILPGPYAVGVISVLFTKRHQRVGDLAAGTLVVRERTHQADTTPLTSLRVEVPPGFDVTAIDDDHLTLARQYLARRESLAPTQRRRLAAQVADVLRPRVGPSGASLRAEELIEAVVAAKEGGEV